MKSTETSSDLQAPDPNAADVKVLPLRVAKQMHERGLLSGKALSAIELAAAKQLGFKVP